MGHCVGFLQIWSHIQHELTVTITYMYTGVGGIEAEAVMLGQTISMVLPKVVGYKLTGKVGKWTTSTDVVLTITKVIVCVYF